MPTLHSTKILGDLRVTGLTNLYEVGAFTLTGQLTSTVATGTAPFVIASTTRVANLNAATAGTADQVANALTVGTGLTLSSGTTYNGSAALTIS